MIVLVALPTIVWQQYHYSQVQSANHAKSAAQQAEILKVLNEHTDTLNEVHQLRTEVTKLVEQYGPALTTGQKQIIAEYTWIACSLSNGASKCGPAPP